MNPPPPKPPSKPSAPPAKPPTSAKPATASRPAKTFSLAPASSTRAGQKIILYGRTGAGKTTLASMAPGAVFIALDKNASKIINPQTQQEVQPIAGINDFQDARDALRQNNLFAEGSTVVVDTLTKLEALSEQYIFDHYPLKGGKATHMRAYGWDGPAHYLDVMRLVLTDLDPLVERGVNVVLLAQQGQIRIPNASGLDYLEDGPKLSHNNQSSSRMEVCEWADQVLRIGYLNFEVAADNDKARVGKANGTMDRAVFSGGAAHYVAKSRPIDGKHLPTTISFANEEDDSLWAMIFGGAIPDAV